MITNNVYERTFHIKFGNSTGTAFTIDKDSRQYIATARHVVEGITSGDVVSIYHDRQWKEIRVNVIGVGKGEADIAVLATSIQLSPTHLLEANEGGLTYGQQVYFLGFPFGWDGGADYLNRGFAMPFVKSGVLSAIIVESETRIYLDAQVNEGFSGGPLVFVPNGQPLSQRNEFKVAGIVVNFPTPKIRPVVNNHGDQVFDQNNNLIGIRENPGFVVAIGIKHAVELIDQNPIGFQLPVGQDSS